MRNNNMKDTNLQQIEVNDNLIKKYMKINDNYSFVSQVMSHINSTTMLKNQSRMLLRDTSNQSNLLTMGLGNGIIYTDENEDERLTNLYENMVVEDFKKSLARAHQRSQAVIETKS